MEGVYSFLDDGRRHINAALAQSIFEWDSAHQKSNDENNTRIDKQKSKYSTCNGICLVDSITKEILSASTGAASTIASSSASIQDDSAATSSLL
eukprot:662628-Ditylum_brightwellii.AAC.1